MMSCVQKQQKSDVVIGGIDMDCLFKKLNGAPERINPALVNYIHKKVRWHSTKVKSNLESREFFEMYNVENSMENVIDFIVNIRHFCKKKVKFDLQYSDEADIYSREIPILSIDHIYIQGFFEKACVNVISGGSECTSTIAQILYGHLHTGKWEKCSP